MKDILPRFNGSLVIYSKKNDDATAVYGITECLLLESWLKAHIPVLHMLFLARFWRLIEKRNGVSTTTTATSVAYHNASGGANQSKFSALGYWEWQAEHLAEA